MLLTGVKKPITVSNALYLTASGGGELSDRYAGVAKRLTNALELRGREKKAFGLAMRNRLSGRGGQKGVSYQTILSYFDGTYVPSLEWLAEAADELEVRLPWLALNQGARTQEEELHRQQSIRFSSEDVQLSRAAVTTAVFEAMPALRPVGHPDATRMIFACVPDVAEWIGRHGANVREFASDQERYAEAGRMLGEAISAPLRALHLDPTLWPDHAKRVYIAQVLATLASFTVLAYDINLSERSQGRFR
jgi:hypothetical protein